MMDKEDERDAKAMLIKRELRKIAAAYPTLAGVMKAKPTDTACVGHLWATEFLIDCNLDDVANYCDEVAHGERLPVPEGEANDRLGFYIRAYCEQKQFELERAREKHEERIRYQAEADRAKRDRETLKASGALAGQWKKQIKAG